jgi:hypothetical protein
MPPGQQGGRSINLKLKKFNMKWIGEHKILTFIGKRNTGKSILVMDYLYHNQSFPFGTVISPTDDYNLTYRPHVPGIFIHSDYSQELIEASLDRQKDIARNCAVDPAYAGVDPSGFLLLDDCLADAGDWANDKNIKWIFMNGRHVKMTFILTMQYAMGIPPPLRANIDWIFICKEPKLCNKKRLYEHYAGIFPTFEMFRVTLDAVTKNYGCMVIDNGSTSDRLEDQVFWYRTDPKQYPDWDTFKLCHPTFWKDNDEINRMKIQQGQRKPQQGTSESGGYDYNHLIGKKNGVNYNIRLGND